MNKTAKGWLIAASVLTVLGIIVCAVAFAAAGFDFKKFGTIKFEEKTYEIKEEFENIDLKIDTADLTFEKSDDDTCKIVSYDRETTEHTVTVKNGTLTLETKDERSIFEHLGITFESAKITVYLPDDKYVSLKIDTDTGDIEITDKFSFGDVEINGSTSDVDLSCAVSDSLKIKISTGDVKIDGVNTDEIDIKTSTGCQTIAAVTCKNLTARASTGDVTLRNVKAEGSFDIEAHTGDVTFDKCDAAKICVKTSTGDVTGTLLSGKDFDTDTSTGEVDVPSSSSGGTCRIRTSTGDIEISIP